MQNNKKQVTEKSRKRDVILSVTFITLFILYFAARIGFFMGQLEEPNLLLGISVFAENFMEKPWQVYPTNMGSLAIGLIAALFADVLIFYRYLIIKDTVENAHGTAAFEKDYDQYEREFVCSPRTIGEVTGIEMTDHNCPRNEEGKKVYAGLKKPFSSPKQYRDAVEVCRRRSMIYTDTIYLSLDGGWCQRNANSIVFGASGTGKSRYFLKPNILQGKEAGSFICTDPSGDIMQETGDFLKREGYIIKCFNISDMTKSCRFNPLHYIRDTKDIPIIAKTFLDNMKGEGASKGADGDFWDKAAEALLCCCIGYLYEVCPIEERNFANVLDLMRLDKHDENEQGGVDSDFDIMFKALGNANPASYAFQCYQTYRQAPIRTANSILISTTVNLQQLDIPEVRNLTYKDEMELDQLGCKPMAIFLNIPQADKTYCWLTAMLYSLLFKRLYTYGEERMKLSALSIDIDEYHTWLEQTHNTDNNDSIAKFAEIKDRSHVTALGNPEMKYYVRFLIDECANVGKIPNLEKYLATCRKYRIAIVPIFQNYSQIVEVYGKDKANNIVSNCDAFLFLGGSDEDTLKIIQSHLGKETVKTLSNSMSYSSKGNNSANKQQTGKDLMTRDQIETMSNAECLLFIRALRPFKTKKYALERHPNYEYLSEGSKGETFPNPFFLSNNDETDELIESVRIKSATEVGYHKPKVVDNARRRNLIATNKMKVEELRNLMSVLEGELAILDDDESEKSKKRTIIDNLRREIQALESTYMTFDTDVQSSPSGISKSDPGLRPSDETISNEDMKHHEEKSSEPEFVADYSSAVMALDLGGYTSAYEFDSPTDFSLDKFMNGSSSASSSSDVQEQALKENSEAVASLFGGPRPVTETITNGKKEEREGVDISVLVGNEEIVVTDEMAPGSSALEGIMQHFSSGATLESETNNCDPIDVALPDETGFGNQ